LETYESQLFRHFSENQFQVQVKFGFPEIRL